ncbi:sugar transferase [Candidatus Dojkabacteria bacterium]|nr:sugar transferase [Candidatus Dojkabacteria bacterium]
MYKFFKRILDVVCALLFLTVLGPVMLVIALAIKLEDPAGPIFADTPDRVGKGGKNFFMYKFRSMIPNAHEYLESHPELKKKYEAHQGKLKIEQDPRITKVGSFIRRVDLDELPQFINVLKGEMSIVGPRACYPDERARYIRDFPEFKDKINSVLRVKPGITGLWQVSGRNALTLKERFRLEADYVKFRNFWLDLKIMLMTPIVILTRKGAYE